ncbi:MAG: DUF1801 domain-containing protein [Rhodoferax sp.]|nr:DUF1801 domain-containing protein [Rhodoferax sp.]
MSTPRVTQLLEDIRALDQDRHALVQALRKHIFDLGPSVSEEVKYGGLLFSAGTPFCGVFAYAKHVSLEFGAGACQTRTRCAKVGKLRRHIKLTTLQDISDKHVQAYLALALQASAKPQK